MAIENVKETITLISGESMALYQFYIGKVNSSGYVVRAGLGEAGCGIIYDNVASGYACLVVTSGIAMVTYGSSVTAGVSLMSSAAGKAVTATAGYDVIGIALESGSDGEVHPVLLQPKRGSTLAAGEQGDVMYYSGSAWVYLNHGTANQVLKTGGHGANPSWAGIAYTGHWIFYTLLADIADGDLITEWCPGFAGTLISFDCIVEKAATTAAKASTLNLEVGTTDVTGGVVGLTSANCTPKGARVAGSAITANNAFGASDVISIEASSTTAFSEGSVWMVVKFTATLSAV
jgi:hypothetical protein